MMPFSIYMMNEVLCNRKKFGEHRVCQSTLWELCLLPLEVTPREMKIEKRRQVLNFLLGVVRDNFSCSFSFKLLFGDDINIQHIFENPISPLFYAKKRRNAILLLVDHIHGVLLLFTREVHLLMEN